MNRFQMFLALLLASGHAGATETVRPERPAETSGGTVEAVNAHTDKAEFLRAVSLLGRSPEEDKALLFRITGMSVEPVLNPNSPSKRFKKWHSTNVSIRDGARIAEATSFNYGITTDGRYVPSIFLYLNGKFACIRFDDLASVFGSPVNNPRLQPSPHLNRTGPSDIWFPAYALPSGLTAWFHFSTKTCASRLNLSIEKEKAK